MVLVFTVVSLFTRILVGRGVFGVVGSSPAGLGFLCRPGVHPQIGSTWRFRRRWVLYRHFGVSMSRAPRFGGDLFFIFSHHVCLFPLRFYSA